MDILITDIISQNDSDDDVIEVVRDEAPIEIISDDDEPASQNATVIQNYHFIPPMETSKRKDLLEPVAKDPLETLSQSTDSECVLPSPHAAETLLSEPLPLRTEDTNDTASSSAEANGKDDINSVASMPIKLPLPLLLPDLDNNPKDINNKDAEVQPNCHTGSLDIVIDAKV